MNNINTISSSELPSKLQTIPDPPKKLWYRGQFPDVRRLHVAIVGSRKPSAYGRQVTEQISRGLAERGAVIVSGMAHGVDGIAHQACIRGNGTTIAVLPGGIDSPYPASHRGLAEDIVDSGGLLMSEDEPGLPAMQFRCLKRNRLVIGMADLLIVTEANLRGGSMGTATLALEQGKDVYAVPGNITSPLSGGPNALIASGAHPITYIEQFVDELLPKPKARKNQAYTVAEKTILELLEGGISDGDELQQKSGLATAMYLQTITMLEITGAVKPLGNNRWGL